MHEASIALCILEIAEASCREAGCGSISSIRVRIGRAAGVMPEALLFAFDAFKEDTLAKDATLDIERVPVAGVCGSCSTPFTVPEDVRFVTACPCCGSASFRIRQGREMEILEVEAD
ncbi:MAG: hydrogenase maturation nickel metallochaperone HypA [Deltaproteobacteria bacterium]|nr:hydrogenase maturation nickel metallochaperone HypA [Deltaproteobacteria bacterium]